MAKKSAEPKEPKAKKQKQVKQKSLELDYKSVLAQSQADNATNLQEALNKLGI